MLPPFYYKGASDEALAASYDRVIEGVGTKDFRLVLYHIPQVSGVPITTGLVDMIKDKHPDTLAGIKDSTGDWDHSKMLIERFPDLAVFPGAENLVAAGLKVGGAGCISAGCNVNARAIRQLYDEALADKDIARPPRRGRHDPKNPAALCPHSGDEADDCRCQGRPGLGKASPAADAALRSRRQSPGRRSPGARFSIGRLSGATTAVVRPRWRCDPSGRKPLGLTCPLEF